jgi:uncharacterized Zn-finger protein
VKKDDQMPQQLCMTCVSELNKSFAFREKCIRTFKIFCSLFDINSSDEDDENKRQEASVTIVHKSTNKKNICTPMTNDNENEANELYEEIEVTQDLLDAAKARVQESSVNDVLLEMDEITTLLNNSQTSDTNVEMKDDNYVYIIQSTNDNIEEQENDDENIAQESTEQKDKDANGSETFHCSICVMSFVRRKNFYNHQQKFHSNDQHDNDGGEAPEKRIRLKLTNDDKKAEKMKQELESNPNAKKCKNCDALYMNEKSLKLHERRNMCQQESYECTQCKKVFTDQQLFKKHTESHPQNTDQGGETATAIASTSDPLRKHSCSECGKCFKMLSTLKDHLRIHRNEKPFSCNICNRGFSQSANLKQHLRRHTQVKPFKCLYENCTSSFVSKGELDSHSRKHSGEHPFKCDICSSSFTTSSSLVKHKRLHSGEVKFSLHRSNH